MPARVLRRAGRTFDYTIYYIPIEKHECPQGYYDSAISAGRMECTAPTIEKHECPQGYYDRTPRQYTPPRQGANIEKHECP